MTPNEKNIIKTTDEREELPLSALKLSFKPNIVDSPVFFYTTGLLRACVTTRFSSLKGIESFLEEQHRAGRGVYLYKLYGQMVVYGEKAEPTYTLRYSITAGSL